MDVLDILKTNNSDDVRAFARSEKSRIVERQHTAEETRLAEDNIERFNINSTNTQSTPLF
jgi:hypothetical protein